MVKDPPNTIVFDRKMIGAEGKLLQDLGGGQVEANHGPTGFGNAVSHHGKARLEVVYGKKPVRIISVLQSVAKKEKSLCKGLLPNNHIRDTSFFLFRFSLWGYSSRL